MNSDERWNRNGDRKMTGMISRETANKRLQSNMRYLVSQEMLQKERRVRDGCVYLLHKQN